MRNLETNRNGMATSDAINSINIGVEHISVIPFGRAREALSNGMFDHSLSMLLSQLIITKSAYPLSAKLRATFN